MAAHYSQPPEPYENYHYSVQLLPYRYFQLMRLLIITICEDPMLLNQGK